MNIGHTIKKLRKDRDITQEKFAEYLNMTPQAISRWENGTSYPDIATLPLIAEFFNVSSDYLLGIEVDKREEEIQTILAQYRTLLASGDQNKRLDLVKNAVSKHPGEFRLLIRYADELLASPYDGINGHTDMTQDEIHGINSDVIKICERILEDCTIDEVRYSTFDTMSMVYLMEDDLTNSEKYAKMLPNWYQSSNMVLYRIMGTDSFEHTKFRQTNIADLANMLWYWIRSEVCVKKTPDAKITLCKKALSVYQTLYENGDYGYANELIGQIWEQLGDVYLETGDKDAAIEAITKMVEHKTIMDRLDGTSHTSVLFDKLIFKQDDLSRSFTCTNREIVLGWLEEKKYDCIRDDERFQNLVNGLRS